MAVDKLTPSDPRVQHKTTILNGVQYHYLLGEPTGGAPRATIFLIHGFPDLSFGWRYQVPALLSLNLRVVVPDMMGYGQTAAPEDLSYYTGKRAADDIATLAAELGAPQIFLLGHDWGGFIVWRTALWHPALIKGVISICTPFTAPAKAFLPMDKVVQLLPNFRYQVQFQGPEVQNHIVGKPLVRAFLNALYGAQAEDGTRGFSTHDGVLFDNLQKLPQAKLLSAEELDFYAETFAQRGLGAPLNWYRTRELNFKDEKVLADKEDLQLPMPALLVQATRDVALPPSMAQGMDKFFKDLKIAQVDATHWAPWEAAADCNALITEFVEGVLAGRGGAVL